MKEVIVDQHNVYGLVWIENIEEFLKNFEWTKVTIDLYYISKMINFFEEFTNSINYIKCVRENRHIEIIAAKNKSENKTILFAKPVSTKGCFFVIAGIISDEEADENDPD